VGSSRVLGLRRAALAPGLVVLLLTLSGCQGRNSTFTMTPSQLFDRPPSGSGYSWSFKGIVLDPQVISSTGGPPHCGWQAATFLQIGRPPGTYSANLEQARLYVRDPRHVVPTTMLLASLDLHAQLPIDAKPTGLEYNGVEIEISQQSADVAVYVTGGNITERWPRVKPSTGCD
jgi:hypothetical protein